MKIVKGVLEGYQSETTEEVILVLWIREDFEVYRRAFEEKSLNLQINIELKEKKMKVTIIQGDIPKIKADAIVNAAGVGFGNAIGGGVAGAIRRAAGEELVKECQKLSREKYPRGLPTGEAVATGAYNLPAKIIIHTVGPRYYKDNPELLKNCYINSLKIAEENNCKTIAFPAISTGAYGCPIEKSVKIVKEVTDNFKSEIIKEVILVLYTKDDFEVYKRGFGEKRKKTKLLFICSGGLDRSPTAASLFENNPEFEAKSCGIYPLTNSNIVTKHALEWADVIFVMEYRHKADILERFPLFVKDKPEIIVLDISNEYIRNQPELIEILKTKLKMEGFL